MNELVPVDIRPIRSVSDAIAIREEFHQYVTKCLVEGKDRDYGAIPGMQKKILFKPGAEKLATLFGLTPRYEEVKSIEDFTGALSGGEPLFYYRFRCRLFRGDYEAGQAEASCHSREPKYRYRKAERVCPQCGKATIIKGKAEYGGGWLCWKNKGGCSAKFKDSDQAIEGQPQGQTLNPDVADLANTILQMAQKRSFLAAVRTATNASEFFTQDMDDAVPPDPRDERPNNSNVPEALDRNAPENTAPPWGDEIQEYKDWIKGNPEMAAVNAEAAAAVSKLENGARKAVGLIFLAYGKKRGWTYNKEAKRFEEPANA